MLDGIKVVSLTHYLQGPSCVQYLADLGADVVKVEKVGGAYERHWSGAESYLGDESVFYLLAGRNQRSIELDLRDPRGAEVLWRLVEECDVLVQNFRPGALERLGFSYEAVAARNPSIVYCALSGYGPRGPLAGEPGQDLLIQSISGLLDLTGGADAGPTPVGTAVVDQHGATLGALGILAALVRRARTGQGCRVDANLLSAALNLQLEPLSYHLNGTELYPKSATGLASRFHQAPYGAYETADGWLTISLSAGDALADALELDALRGLTRAEQFRRREEVSDLVGTRLRERTTEHWLAVLPEHGIWCAPVRTYADVVDDPQVRANGAFLDAHLANGEDARLLAHPIAYDGDVPGLRTPPPVSGADTVDVLESLGYPPDVIRDYLASGVAGRSGALPPTP